LAVKQSTEDERGLAGRSKCESRSFYVKRFISDGEIEFFVMTSALFIS